MGGDRGDDGNRLGTARGLRLPGILPEPAAIESEAGELSDSERAVLRDLQALPAEDRDEESAVPLDIAEQERPRAQLPWWLGSAFFVLAGLASLAAATMEGPVWRTLLFASVGIVWLWMAAQAWRHRRRE